MTPVQSTTYKMTFVRRTVLPFNSYLLKIGSTVPSGFSVQSVQVLGIQWVQLVTIVMTAFLPTTWAVRVTPSLTDGSFGTRLMRYDGNTMMCGSLLFGFVHKTLP